MRWLQVRDFPQIMILQERKSLENCSKLRETKVAWQQTQCMILDRKSSCKDMGTPGGTWTWAAGWMIQCWASWVGCWSRSCVGGCLRSRRVMLKSLGLKRTDVSIEGKGKGIRWETEQKWGKTLTAGIYKWKVGEHKLNYSCKSLED